MSAPDAALQKAMAGALRGANVADKKIYDRVQDGKEPLYVAFGPAQVIDDSVDCVDGYEVFQQIDVWSRAVGSVEAKTVAGQVRAALHEAELTLAGFRLIEIRHQDTRVFADPDGLTTHAALSFRALIQETN